LALVAAVAISLSSFSLFALQARAREPLALLVPIIVLTLLAFADVLAAAAAQ
jgi:hypothetical protein